MKIARVALDVPLDEAFDFVAPGDAEIPRGSLVVVPFGRARKVGVVVANAAASQIPATRLKVVESVVDDVPPLDAAVLDLLEFCSG